MAAGNSLSAAPFVLTLELDGEAFARLNELRRRHYPPDRNLVPAHVTLFHQLPGERAREIKALLRQVATRQKPIAIAPGEAKLMERGVGDFPPLAATRHVARDAGE